MRALERSRRPFFLRPAQFVPHYRHREGRSLQPANVVEGQDTGQHERHHSEHDDAQPDSCPPTSILSVAHPCAHTYAKDEADAVNDPSQMHWHWPPPSEYCATPG